MTREQQDCFQNAAIALADLRNALVDNRDAYYKVSALTGKLTALRLSLEQYALEAPRV